MATYLIRLFVGLVVLIVTGCSSASKPAPELCLLVAPHQFSEASIDFYGSDDPAIAADRDWIADVLKSRRCLCGEDKTGCPE